MRNEKREQQMMAAADVYVEKSEEIYNIVEAITDFCAGWRAADQHPAWVSVQDELPKETGWYLVATPTLNSKIDVALWDGKWRRLVTITHWMPLPTPPAKKGGEE